MIKVLKYSVGQLNANCYFAIDSKTKETAIIDPGDDANYLSEKILQNDLKPNQIIATHGHFDHVMAITELRLNFKIPFLMNEKDKFIIKRTKKTAKYFTNQIELPSPRIDRNLINSDYIYLGNDKLKVISTPGHTPGSICLYSKENNIVFTGDIIFADGYIGRTDFSYGDDNKLLSSINMILKLPNKTLVYPGHGEEFYVKNIKNMIVN